MLNGTTNYSRSSSSSHIPIEPLYTWYWIVRGVISILTIAGNGLVIYLIAFKRHLRVTNNWFVLSLAVSDFCLGLFTTTSGFACTFYFRCDWRLQIAFYNFLLFSSTMNLWAMAIDRYIAIVHSLRYASLMTTRRVIAVISTSWSISFFAGFVRLLWIYSSHLSQTIDRYYRVVVDLLFGAASCFALIFIYVRVFLISRKIAKHIAIQETEVNHNYKANNLKFQRQDRRRLSTRLLGSVVLLFVLCNALSVYVSFCLTFQLCSVKFAVRSAAYSLVHFNSAVNFVVYAFIKKDIRFELIRMYRCSNSVDLSEPHGEFSLTRISRTSACGHPPLRGNLP